MDQVIDLPDKFFNKESTDYNTVEDKGYYSLENDYRSDNSKKPQDLATEDIAKEETHQNSPKTTSNISNNNINYNTNNTKINNLYSSSNITENQEVSKQSNNESNISNNSNEGDSLAYNFYNDKSVNSNNNKTSEETEIIRPNLNNEDINSNISNIDKKINELQGKLDSIKTSEKSQLDNVINNDTFNSNVNNFNIEEESSPVTVVPNLYYGEKQQIKNNIQNLQNQKTKLLNLLSSTNVTNLNNTNTSNNETGEFLSKNDNIENYSNTNNVDNVSENFTPNLTVNNNSALEKAVFTEKALGGDPVIVNSPELGEVVIDKRQGTLENAINEHGGLENAISDSIENQNMVENFYSDKNINETTITENNLPDFDNADAVDSIVKTAPPDTGQMVATDTRSIINMLGSITTQLASISNNISKIKIPSQTNNTYSPNFFTNAGKSGVGEKTAQPAQQGEREPLKTGIKGNLPLSDYFPNGFNTESLGVSNLLSRV